MSDKYKIRDNDKAYFLTSTVAGWVDVLTMSNHKMLLINSLYSSARDYASMHGLLDMCVVGPKPLII